MNELTIRKAIEKINDGEIRIPSFQREYVWSSEQVAFLLDSIYKEIPIGSLFLWKTNEKLKYEKDFGNFELPEPGKDYPIHYVLDGQQRLTSLFTVFQTSLEPTKTNHNWNDIYYDFEANDLTQESKFVPLSYQTVDRKRYFPMNTLFDPVVYRKATEHLDDERVRVVDEVQSKFKEFIIPKQEIETTDKGKIAIVFERINRAGTDLDTFQLLSAWTWSSDFNLADEIDELADELSSYGFAEIADDKELIMKCCSGVILGEASPQSIMNLKGETVRHEFNKIKNGIRGSIDFLNRELNISGVSIMPYPAMMVGLTNFFASERINGELYNEKQRKELIRWFWRSCFARRYSSGITDTHRIDLKNLKELRNNFDHRISDFECKIDSSFFRDNVFNMRSVNTKAFILLLSSNNPRSFISGARVDLQEVLNKASRAEFHHIFPKKHLQRLGVDNKDINSLQNFCFLNSADNQKIKDKAPSEYIAFVNSDNADEVLRSNFCEMVDFHSEYEVFKKKRSGRLVLAAEELIK